MYREPKEKLVKGKREDYGSAYSRPPEFDPDVRSWRRPDVREGPPKRAPYDSGMGRDPIRGDGQEEDPTLAGGSNRWQPKGK
jgi:hypothetical protein